LSKILNKIRSQKFTYFSKFVIEIIRQLQTKVAPLSHHPTEVSFLRYHITVSLYLRNTKIHASHCWAFEEQWLCKFKDEIRKGNAWQV